MNSRSVRVELAYFALHTKQQDADQRRARRASGRADAGKRRNVPFKREENWCAVNEFCAIGPNVKLGEESKLPGSLIFMAAKLRQRENRSICRDQKNATIGKKLKVSSHSFIVKASS